MTVIPVKGGFWIELASPLKSKLELLLEFVEENKLLGVLDKRYAKQWLGSFDAMHVTALKINVLKCKKPWTLSGELWRLRITIRGHIHFRGEGSTFEDAIIGVCEDIEHCVAS